MSSLRPSSAVSQMTGASAALTTATSRSGSILPVPKLACRSAPEPAASLESLQCTRSMRPVRALMRSTAPTSASPAAHAWQITGPRPASLAAVAAHCGARHVKVPLKAIARTLRRRGADDFERDHAVRMAAYFAAGSDGSTTDHVLRLTGRQPRSIEAFLDEHRSSFSPETGLARALHRNPTKESR